MSERVFVRRLLEVLVVVALAAAFVLAADVFFVLVLALVYAVFLAKTSQFLASKTPLNYGWSLTVVKSLVIGAIIASIVLFGYQIVEQVEKASDQLDEGIKEVGQLIQDNPILGGALRQVPVVREILPKPPQDASDASKSDTSKSDTSKSDASKSDASKSDAAPQSDGPSPQRSDAARSQDDSMSKVSPAEIGEATAVALLQSDSDGADEADPSRSTSPNENAESSSAEGGASGGDGKLGGEFTSRVLKAAGDALKTTMGVFVNCAVIFFVGLFFAVKPAFYRDVLVVLFPPDVREDRRELFNEVGDYLWRWLIGRMSAMVLTGVGSGILLAVCGVPLAFTIGLATAILTFIPNIGAVVALGLAVLAALPQGGTVTLTVIVGYVVLQLIESNVITPLIQQRQVEIPPGYLISFQAIFSVLFGFLGTTVATPVLAMGMVVVKRRYVQDFLENRGEDRYGRGVLADDASDEASADENDTDRGDAN